MRSSLIKFAYDVVRLADEVVLCTGETTHVVVGRDMKKRVMPQRYQAAFRSAVVETTEGEVLPEVSAAV